MFKERKPLRQDFAPRKEKRPNIMVDVGISPTGLVEGPASPKIHKATVKNRPKKHYPSAHIEKKGFKMGQKVVLHGHVSGVREDEYGSSTEVKIKKMGIHKGG